MSLCVTQEGAEAIWQQIFAIASLGSPNVHLVGQPFTPAHSDTYSTYGSIELVVPGYAPIALNNPSSDWSIAPLNAGAQATYVQLNWTFSGACSVYGYWVANQANSLSLWSELFSSPVVFGSSGGQFPLILPPTLTSLP
jgi:hypothetical protein